MFFRKKNSREKNAVLCEGVISALSSIVDERTGESVIESGFVSNVAVTEEVYGRRAALTLELVGGRTPHNQKLAETIEAAAKIRGIEKVQLVMTEHVAGVLESPASQQADAQSTDQKVESSASTILPDVRHIIAVTSGKGGVGKSTIAANLAVTLQASGARVGFLDADIHGPSASVLFGITETPELQDGKALPVQAYGVQVMSMSMLVEERDAMAWRGPMTIGAVMQLIRDVNWGQLDYLIIDTPPGTGDVHLTLLQKTNLSGAIIVSTPHQMALADIKRGVMLLRKMNTPILGLIENMSVYEGPDGRRMEFFGRSNGRETADELDIPFIGQIPLLPHMIDLPDRARARARATQSADQSVETIFAEICRKITATLS